MNPNKYVIVMNMCTTARHDFNIVRPEGTPSQVGAGVTNTERNRLYDQMSQIYDHVIEPIVNRVQELEESATLDHIVDIADKYTNPRKTEVFCTLQIEGTHNWPNCPYEEVDYLRVPHRHVFHIKAYKEVFHSDRDQEFIMLKHEIDQFIKTQYQVDDKYLCTFGAMSCEMIAEELIDAFDLSRCEVSEDNENGAVVTT